MQRQGNSVLISNGCVGIDAWRHSVLYGATSMNSHFHASSRFLALGLSFLMTTLSFPGGALPQETEDPGFKQYSELAINGEDGIWKIFQDGQKAQTVTTTEGTEYTVGYPIFYYRVVRGEKPYSIVNEQYGVAMRNKADELDSLEAGAIVGGAGGGAAGAAAGWWLKSRIQARSVAEAANAASTGGKLLKRSTPVVPILMALLGVGGGIAVTAKMRRSIEKKFGGPAPYTAREIPSGFRPWTPEGRIDGGTIAGTLGDLQKVLGILKGSNQETTMQTCVTLSGWFRGLGPGKDMALAFEEGDLATTLKLLTAEEQDDLQEHLGQFASGVSGLLDSPTTTPELAQLYRNLINAQALGVLEETAKAALAIYLTTDFCSVEYEADPNVWDSAERLIGHGHRIDVDWSRVSHNAATRG